MHTRKDDWPTCPFCGQDELWRAAPLHDLAKVELLCIACRWRGPDPRTAMETTDAPPLETTSLMPKSKR